MSEDSNDGKKKDLTGIFDCPKTDHAPKDEDDFLSLNEPIPLEQVDTFESIDQIGLTDHLPEEALPEPSEEITPLEFKDTPAPPIDFLSNIRSYSERAQETSFDPGTRYPFHLLIHGEFDPYSRDKLLLFITENPVGTTSSELDLQLTGGRVLLPRISEFAGVKLIQDLRDTGLSFKLSPSQTDSDEIIPEAASQLYHFSQTENESRTPGNDPIPVLLSHAVDPTVYQAFDSLQTVQFLKAEILEVEKSEIFQDLLDRMTESLKRRAVIRGGKALTHLEHKITPLRLPSQYQIELRATILKKIGT